MAIRQCVGKCDLGYGPCTGAVETFKGAVLGTYERNGYDDSDFYAVVWDAEKQALHTVTYGTTRFWTYHNGAEADITEENLEAARAWGYAEYIRRALWRDAAAIQRIEIGREVEVKRGRKVAIREGSARCRRLPR